MAENSILLELNITAKDTRKSLDNVTASLKKLRGESERAIAKLRGLTQSLNISKTAAGELSSELDALSTKFSRIATNAGFATKQLKNFAKAAKGSNQYSPKGSKIVENPLANVNNPFGQTQNASYAMPPSTSAANALVPLTATFYEQADAASAASDSVMDYEDNTKKAGHSVINFKNALSTLASVSGTVAQKLRGAAKNTFNYAKESIKAKRATDKSTGSLGKLVAALGRVAFYRAIRTLLKEVAQAFREGVNNLTLYSQALNNLDSSHANQTMSEFATIALYVKNTLGAMVMPVLQALVPVVNAIANAFAAAANAVNQFFHALKGETVFTKARKYAVDYADGLDTASGKAKELKKQIFGFDELNIFDAPSNGGRGGGAEELDYSKMFEESPVASWIQKIARDGNWESLGAIFAMKVNGMVKKFDAAKAGADLGAKIQSVVGTAFGFLDTFDFTRVGSKAAEFLNNAIGQIKAEELGHIFATKWTAALDFLIGFITKFDTKKLTSAISKFIIGAFDHLSEWLDSVDWYEFGGTLYEKIKGAVEGIDFAGIADSLFTFLGKAIRAGWELGKGFVTNLAGDISAYFKQKADECGGSTILGFFKGILDIFNGINEWVYNHIFLPFWNALTGGNGFNIANGASEKIKTVGTAIVNGFLVPISTPFKTIQKWITEHIVTPFLDGSEKGFDISNGESGSLKGIGKAVVDGFFAGLKASWKSIADWISQKANAVKTAFRGIIDGVKNFDAKSPRQLDFGTPVGLYAEGGQPQTGSLFYAGEAGAELVGQVGGRTTVTTHDQFSEGMADIMDNTNTVILQAAQALIQAIQSKPVPSIHIGDRDIVSMYDRGKTLAGSALVE